VPGRPRKSTAAHELSGSFEKHPERKAARANEPKPEGPLGQPPQCFNPLSPSGLALIGIWNEVVSQVPPGLLTLSDRFHVELSCRLILRIRTSSANSGDYSRLDVLLGKMGMNPADRSRVNLVPGALPNAANGDSTKSGGANEFQALAKETIRARPN
jgi:hypothetical protein